MSENKVKKREDISKEFKWDIESMYNNEEIWKKDFDKVKDLKEKIKEYKGKVVESGKNLLSLLKLKDEISRTIANVYTFAKMKQDEDTNNSKYQELTDKASTLMVNVQEALSFIVPEILSIDKEKIDNYIKENEELKLYEHYLNQIFRQKDHILSDKEESIIAQIGDVASGPENIFSMLNNADLEFPTIKDENGEDIEITHGRFIPLMENENRRVRKDAYEGLYSTYRDYKNTFSTTLSTNVKKNIFYSKVRKYNSSLQAALDEDNIPTSVYDNLIKAVHNNLDKMHKYIKLRKKALNLEELHFYDLYTPIVEDIKMDIEYNEARDIVVKGLGPLKEEYVNVVKDGFNSGWVDVYENKGKRSGAYSWGTYDSKPYILLNYQNTLDNMFTIAHEMGHSMHSYLSKNNQPYIYSGYSIFVAEVASTVNEALLMNYMLESTKDDKKKLFLLNHYLEQFRGTIYRQTMFAEFEKLIHERAENGESLTAESFSSIYRDLNKKYYGDDIVIDDNIAMEWARIPHFYYNFYVYQYATGFSAAIALSQKILNEGDESVDKYLTFLKSGSSNYPIEVLKSAGVDMTTEEPVNNALKIFGELVDKMEDLL
ncbi:oligoendopeptidase F [Clostridium sp. D2Q-11]|uniref:Oligopeptidase F n=1 Tax=Anaeromonas frigoriresistens TaxID=2683708 RepID=A0A942Z7R6_9FIRM|nr:oligoendopeptidase F [Anaeromonas frigoriresistens]MBS4537230.1 oligoendopeptidase F [Anaeromonas frigoriresistens]